MNTALKGGMSVRQQSLSQAAIPKLSTCEWYQMEKESYGLSSPCRPKTENTLSFSFRQTSFPELLKD